MTHFDVTTSNNGDNCTEIQDANPDQTKTYTRNGTNWELDP